MEALLKRGFEWIGSAMFTSRRASLTGWTKRREEGGRDYFGVNSVNRRHFHHYVGVNFKSPQRKTLASF